MSRRFSSRCVTFSAVWVILFALSTIHELQAQQTDQTPVIQTSSSLLNTIQQSFFFDELGLELTSLKFYEGYIDPESYILGPGDLLGIALHGNTRLYMRGIRVNSQGNVFLPEAGVAHVGSMTLAEAQNHLNELFENRLPETRTVLFLEHPRTVQVTLSGNVPYSGPHLVYAATRADQAIYHAFFQPDRDTLQSRVATSGPLLMIERMMANKYPADFLNTSEHNLRDIAITRSTGEQLSADLVRFLRTGDQSANPRLMDGDILHIRKISMHSPEVSVSGAVNHEFNMPFRSDDTIERLIEMAGGKSFDAQKNRVQVYRQTPTGMHMLVLSSPQEITQFSLQPNDRIIVPFDREKRLGFSVQVSGEAIYPGRYPIIEGKTTLHDLYEAFGGLTSTALAGAAYLVRQEPGKTESGIREPIDPDLFRRTSDQFIEGFMYLELESQIMQNRVHVNLNSPEQMKRVVLYDGDELHVPKNEGTVFVFGQVNEPGYYAFEAEYTFLDYIVQAGDFALSAEQERMFVIKAGSGAWYRAGQIAIEPGDILFVDRTPFDELQASRMYDLQKRTQRNHNIQLIMTGLTTITSIITAYVAITR